MQQHKFRTTEDAQASYGFAQPAAAALPVPLLTDEQKADYNPEFVLIDPRPISAERWREIAQWHDACHPVAREDIPLEEEWQRVNDLINALEDSRESLRIAEMRADLSEAGTAECTAEIGRLSHLLEEERRESAERERVLNNTIAAFELVEVALKEHNRRVLAAASAPPLAYDEAEKLAAAGWDKGKVAQINSDRPAEPETPAASPCQRDCQTCEKKEPAAPVYACAGCGATDWEIVEVGRNCNKCADEEGAGGYDADPHADEIEAAAGGGAGVGLQGEPAELWATDPKKIQSYDDYCAACVESGGTRLTKKGWLKHQKLAAKRAGGLQGEEGGGNV